MFQAHEADVVAFVADVAGHASLADLCLRQLELDTPASIGAIVDSLLSMRRLHTLELSHCRMPFDFAPALARLLGSGTLTSLTLSGCTHLIDFHAAIEFAPALRANTTLTSLELGHNGLF
jgi:hypothetical protein